MFGNVSHCMNANVALIEEAYRNGVFGKSKKRAEASTDSDADEPQQSKKRGRPNKSKPTAGEKPTRERKDSGYMLFMREARQKAKEEHKNLKPTEVMSLLAGQWKGLTEAGKQEYKDRAAKGNAEHAVVAGAADGGASASAPASAAAARAGAPAPTAATGSGEVPSGGEVAKEPAAAAKPPLTAEERAAKKAKKKAKEEKKAAKLARRMKSSGTQ